LLTILSEQIKGKEEGGECVTYGEMRNANIILEVKRGSGRRRWEDGNKMDFRIRLKWCQLD
jgi:hypothetical protein